MAATLIKKNVLFIRIKKYKVIYILILPAVICLILFSYLPMAGLYMAFTDYRVGSGLMHIFLSKFIGLHNFQRLFTSSYFYTILGNTIIISLYRLAFVFTTPIVFSILLNELKNQYFKRFVQTVTYLPNFLSTVVIAGLVIALLSPSYGLLNGLMVSLGAQPIHFLADTKYFRGIIVGIDVWQTTGWNAIIYLAAIAGINPEMYEAAIVDGAGRFKRIWHITIPEISNIAVLLLIVNIGNMMVSIMGTGNESIFLLYSPPVYSLGDVIDTFAYREGILNASYSYSTAVSFFKSFLGLIMVLSANRVAKIFDKDVI